VTVAVKSSKENVMTILPNAFPGVNATISAPTPPKFKFNKAGKNGNIIAVILDESGSMKSCWGPTIAGFNEFVKSQREVKNAGAAYLTLNKFNGYTTTTVYSGLDINEVPDLNESTYSPSGGTNLLDSIGNTIKQIDAVLAKTDEANRPGVTILIMTDGEENSSRTYSNADIKDMVKAAETSDFSFVFLGANIDSFKVGSAFGMSAQNTAQYSTQNMAATLNTVSGTYSRMRMAKSAGISTQEIYADAMFTETERKTMAGGTK
jgi:hypothetical protein